MRMFLRKSTKIDILVISDSNMVLTMKYEDMYYVSYLLRDLMRCMDTCMSLLKQTSLLNSLRLKYQHPATNNHAIVFWTTQPSSACYIYRFDGGKYVRLMCKLLQNKNVFFLYSCRGALYMLWRFLYIYRSYQDRQPKGTSFYYQDMDRRSHKVHAMGHYWHSNVLFLRRPNSVECRSRSLHPSNMHDWRFNLLDKLWCGL